MHGERALYVELLRVHGEVRMGEVVVEDGADGLVDHGEEGAEGAEAREVHDVLEGGRVVQAAIQDLGQGGVGAELELHCPEARAAIAWHEERAEHKVCTEQPGVELVQAHDEGTRGWTD